SRYRDRLTVIRVVLTGKADARNIAANGLVGMVLALEYLTGCGVRPDGHRLNRSLSEILAKSCIERCRELLTPVAAVAGDQPAPAAAEAPCQRSGRRFFGPPLARNDVDHARCALGFELRRRCRQYLNALDIARGHRLQDVAGVRSLESGRGLAVDQDED